MSPKSKILKRLKNLKNEYWAFILNTSWNTLNQIAIVLLSILLSVIFARFTSKELFGDYNFLNSIVAMLSIIAIPGLNTSMLRSISRGMDGVYVKAVKLSFMWSMLGVPILFLIGGYYYIFSNQIIGLGLFIAAIFFPFIYAPNNWIAMLQGKKRFDIFAKYSIIQAIIRTTAIILAIIIGRTNLILIFMVFMVTSATTNVFLYFKCKQYLKNLDEEEGWKKSGYKLTLNDFVNLSYDNMDKILIGIFLGPVELAVYSIAVSIVSALKGSLLQIIKVLSPTIFTMKKDILQRKLKETFPLLLILNIIMFTLIVFFLPTVMTLLYSQKYADSIFYAQLYSITIPLTFFMGILNTSLVSMKEENAILISRIIGFIVMIILYVMFIPLFGIIGAICASIIYCLLICLLQYYSLISSLHSVN